MLPSEPKVAAVAAVAAVAVAAPTSKELFQEAQPMEHAAGPSESSQVHCDPLGQSRHFELFVDRTADDS